MTLALDWTALGSIANEQIFLRMNGPATKGSSPNNWPIMHNVSREARLEEVVHLFRDEP